MCVFMCLIEDSLDPWCNWEELCFKSILSCPNCNNNHEAICMSFTLYHDITESCIHV